jgi:hypothetical protein
MESYLGQFHTALASYEALDKYILNGALNEALNQIGEIGVDSAKAALQSTKLATYPREQVLLAIGHLQLAQAAYRRQWRIGGGWKHGKASAYINRVRVVGNLARFGESTKAYIYTTFLISACYAWCGEGDLARNELDNADECKQYYDKFANSFMSTDVDNNPNDPVDIFIDVFVTLLGFVNPQFWLSVLKNPRQLWKQDKYFWQNYERTKEQATAASYFHEINITVPTGSGRGVADRAR